VYTHLKSIPCLRTLTVWSFSGRDAEVLGRETNWSLNTEVLALGAIDEFSADLLERLDVARSQSDADLVDFLERLLDGAYIKWLH
jgi:hypothetical protein